MGGGPEKGRPPFFPIPFRAIPRQNGRVTHTDREETPSERRNRERRRDKRRAERRFPTPSEAPPERRRTERRKD